MYDKMQDHDKKMATELVDALLARKCQISVHDGECWACKRSADRATILDAMLNTDADELRIRDANGEKLGWFRLIYGNDHGETINDYTDNDFCKSIVDKVEALNPIIPWRMPNEH